MFDIANPCRGICEVNNKGYCKGCLRKREERFHWNEFTPFQKQLIVNLCARRRAKALAAMRQAECQTTLSETEESDIPQLDLFATTDTSDISSVIPPATNEASSPRDASATVVTTASEPKDQYDLF